MKKLIAMLTIVAMLIGCGTIRNLIGRGVSSTKPPEPIKTEEFFSPEVKTGLVVYAVSYLALFWLAWYLDVVFKEDESEEESSSENISSEEAI